MPVSTLRTKDTVPSLLKRSLPKDLPVHGLLAADLALNNPANSRDYAQWNAVVPTWDDIQLAMPLTWPASLQAHLPPAARQLLAKQRQKFERDWGFVLSTFPLATSKTRGTGEIVVDAACSREQYLYHWLLVNTRTFYFVTPKDEKKLPKEDHMALQPVADLFNHTDKGGCHVSFDHADSFSFRTTRAYVKGEEVHISYGSHSNDFLLVEYGFVLPSNAWDEVPLDDALLPSLSKAQKEELDEVGFLGNYMLDKDQVCHRTQVAARLFLTGMRTGGLSREEWRRFVNGLDDGEKSQQKVDGILVAMLADYLGVVSKEIKAVERIDWENDEVSGEMAQEKRDAMRTMHENQRELLLQRWRQIETLLNDTIKRLQ